MFEEHNSSSPSSDYSDRDYVDLGNNINPSNELTLMGWFKIEDNFGGQRTFINNANLSDQRSFLICSNQNKFGFFVRTNGDLNGGWGISEALISESVNSSGWVHYALSFDGTTGKMYINGHQDPTEVTFSSSAITIKPQIVASPLAGKCLLADKSFKNFFTELFLSIPITEL